MNPKQMQRIYDLALEIWKEKHFSGYPPEHQLMVCTILAFTKVYQQEYGESVPFEIYELPFPLPVDMLDQE